jgi:hypothetical protein
LEPICARNVFGGRWAHNTPINGNVMFGYGDGYHARHHSLKYSLAPRRAMPNHRDKPLPWFNRAFPDPAYGLSLFF